MIRRIVLIAVLVCIATPGCAEKQKAKAANEQDDPIGRKLSERIGPFVQRLPMFFTTNDKYGPWNKEYERLTVDEKIHYCVFQLRNESWSEIDAPHSDKPYSKVPEATASRELIKLGRAAIPQLIRAFDSSIATKIHPSRHFRDPWLVRDVAMDAVEHIACRLFGCDVGSVGHDLIKRLRCLIADPSWGHYPFGLAIVASVGATQDKWVVEQVG